MFIVSWILKLDIALVAVACFTPFALPPPPRFGRGLGGNCINITFSLQSVTFTLCNICNWPLRPSPVTIALSFPTKVCTFLWTKMLVLFSTLLLLSLPPVSESPNSQHSLFANTRILLWKNKTFTHFSVLGLNWLRATAWIDTSSKELVLCFINTSRLQQE